MFEGFRKLTALIFDIFKWTNFKFSFQKENPYLKGSPIFNYAHSPRVLWNGHAHSWMSLTRFIVETSIFFMINARFGFSRILWDFSLKGFQLPLKETQILWASRDVFSFVPWKIILFFKSHKASQNLEIIFKFIRYPLEKKQSTKFDWSHLFVLEIVVIIPSRQP